MEGDLRDWYFYQNKREDDPIFSMKRGLKSQQKPIKAHNPA
jgi:hypothetical protein